jgi:prepilin-type processing-associated H-X9-DG protein
VKNWGVPGAASICPSAPERLARKEVPALNGTTRGMYQGSVTSAWVAQTEFAAFGWWWFQNGLATRHAEKRVGSNRGNNWVMGGGRWWNYTDNLFKDTEPFWTEGEIAESARTPVMADGIHYWWGVGSAAGPRESDLPAENLITGGRRGVHDTMADFCIPRHGSRLANVPGEHSSKEKLPGAVNMAFYDGHAEQVKLEKLWSLYWHRDYQAPAVRPGLK